MDNHRPVSPAFMGFFGPGLRSRRVKEAGAALADKIERLLNQQRAALRDKTDEAIDAVIADEVAKYAADLSDKEVKALRDEVQAILRERAARTTKSAAVRGILGSPAMSHIPLSQAGRGAPVRPAMSHIPLWARRTKDR